MTETVRSMPHSFVEQDLSATELEFEFESGGLQNLRFPMELFERFMGRAAQLVATARSQTLATGDHLAIHGVTVREVVAEAPIGGGKVVVRILGDNGMPINFFVSPAQADGLRKQLFDASNNARKQASRPRH